MTTRLVQERIWSAKIIERIRLVSTIVILSVTCIANNQALAADLKGALPEQVSYPPTSSDEVENANPIKLRVIQNAPSFDLPEVTGTLGLQEAIRLGIKNNLTLKQSEQSWLSSKYSTKAARARFGPAASFHTWYSASSLNQMLFDPYDATVTPTTMQPIVKGSSFSMLFAANQPIYTGGRLLGAYRAAKARERQSLSDFSEQRLSTALKIKEAYWNAALAQATLRVNADYVKFRESSTANMKERLLNGKAPKADYLREHAELAKARIQVNESYRDFNTALLNLKVAMALNVGSQLGLKDSLEYTEVPGDISNYLLDAEKNRPEIQRAIARVAEMRGNKLIAKSKFMPQVGLYGLGSNITGTSPDGNANGKWGGLIGIMGGVTVFDSGSRRNELHAASAALREADFARRDVELKVAQEVSQAWIDLDLARRNVVLAKDEVASAEEDQRLFHARYQIGKSIALEDFEATVKMFQARLTLLEAIYKYRIAQARLTFASGGI